MSIDRDNCSMLELEQRVKFLQLQLDKVKSLYYAEAKHNEELKYRIADILGRPLDRPVDIKE